ncbi:phosphotransferase [Actinoplanes aureus]|uniref:Phosphotransferase n=1 Tax=Actinoplanes aureus TaxID=2792083 RepID=A0A931C745_9ACTN|nr:phosphotransferase [Actinoplanes aureus]MBG0562607.1 phosphotransferase [Actinoplanes aureus]
MTGLLGSGREADVYALDEGRVLRRYRGGGDVTAEVEIMAYVARFDFPVPRVYESRGADMVLERLDGPTLAAAAVTGEVTVSESAGLLADLHRRLHDLPARTGRDPGDRILHLDLHPENVMLTARGPVVIDWRNGTEGPPDLDLAISALILAEVAVDRTHALAQPAGALLAEFLPLAGGDPLSILDRALDVRRKQLAGEQPAQLAEAAAYVTSCR